MLQNQSTFSVQEALLRCIEHREIFPDEMRSLMRSMMQGELSDAQIGAILLSLRTKKETIGEIAAAAEIMRELASTVHVDNPEHLVDIVGTGGDGSHTFNISTASMFVAAAAGATVAKHGNRSVSSTSGSADVLQALGVNIMLTPEQVSACINATRIGFMFAPNHHTAMRNVANVRRELGVRTIFNILGPLSNPAGASHFLMGVFHPDLVGIQIRVLQRLGAQRALVVYGRDGMDEISLGGKTLIGELNNGSIREYEVSPEDFGLKRANIHRFAVDSAEHSRQTLLKAIDPLSSTDDDDLNPAREIVCLNSGAALYVAGVTPDIHSGIHAARTAIASGAARAKLDQLKQFTQTCTAPL